ncbi:uncharacterized protein A1O9_11578 [Exophiala aquamarina CBS 119918]|uniref:Amidohydrolase-related domain-containing protein n=1 Tax=Exophiala aquamarina CBS 119918 TaxID=1182545 RepID=A0A072NZA5_9EURO|nr:uncharacterized protein A1O9_11578 [Exophiala aquamarina CBS 119918]KEF52338.1 hypothetical protein A1O9_11578 [Exophiala aquamarina CBS 119918]
MKLYNIILPDRDPKSRWDIVFDDNTIISMVPAGEAASSPQPASILLPALCHPHIHLDKPYLLTCNYSHPSHYPDYSDLTPQTGTFGEALSFTGQAKARYTPQDLYLRGSQLLATSLIQGVTSCRAFVELDHVTGTQCLDAAFELERAFKDKVDVQICAFAQDPVFSSEHGGENRQILEDTLQKYAGMIAALGTTPYVEASVEASLQNISWAIQVALKHDLHLDFHLDYSLNEGDESGPMVWEVIRLLKEADWNARAKRGKTIVLGHCSRLTMLSNKQMKTLAAQIRDSKLPVHFVGLPTSDLFMMGRPNSAGGNDGDEGGLRTAHRPRGTLQIPSMIRDSGLDACLSVNNVGNAFTPWGSGDPLALASLGVGVYQASTEADARILLECVSTRARRAIGLDLSGRDISGGEEAQSQDLLWEGRKGDILLIKNEEWVGCPGHLGLKIPARQRVGIKDVVWDPPETKLREILR